MKLKVKGEERELNFGVRFVAELDKTQTYDAGHGIEFGMGTMLIQEKLNMGDYEALAQVIKSALFREGVSMDDVYDAIDEYGAENDLEELFNQIEDELKNSKAVRTAKARMQAMQTEQQRAQAKKSTKK